MTTTISNQSKGSNRLVEGSREARYTGTSRVREPGSHDEIRPGGGVLSLDEAILDESRGSTPKAALLSGAKDIVPVALALIPFGAAFGATATGSDLSAVQALGMSVFVFAGAAQLAALPLISAGASMAIVVLTVLIINLRLTLYSASLAPHFKGLSARWKGLLSYLLTDQAYAATITRFDEGLTRRPDKHWYYLGVASAIWVTFQAATMLGVFVGSWASGGWSLDFVLPLVFIALAVPAIKNRTTGAAAFCAGVAALFVAAMPLNLGLITAALVGVVGGLVAETVSGGRKK